MKRVRLWMLLTASLLILIAPRIVESCGPYRIGLGFVDIERPDSLTDYLQGKLQIVQPGFKKRYLFVAYRYLSGKPLSPAELQALKQDWEPASQGNAGQADRNAGRDSLGEWLNARLQVPGAAHMAVEPQQAIGGYETYLNCTDSAFATATRTLLQRIKQFGLPSNEVKLWLEGQDKVFLNCRGTRTIPDSLESNVDPLVRADREYQIGAAYFYAGEWDHARQQLQRVAADPASPWREMAPYVAARALVRKATLSVPETVGFDAVPLASAELELRQILSNKKMLSVHTYARQILDFVEFRLHPWERKAELERRLSRGTEPAQDLVQELTDYLKLPAIPDDDTSQGKKPRQESPRELTDSPEMSEWINQMSISRRSSGKLLWRESVFQSWRKYRDLPWLIAALSSAEESDPVTPQLLEEAQSVPGASPAYVTVHFHQLRLMAGKGSRAEVYAAASDFLERHKAELTRSTVNAFLEVKLRTAPDLDSFKASLARRPADLVFGEKEGVTPCDQKDRSDPPECRSASLDEEGSELVNTLPLTSFASVAQSASPMELRADLLKAVWTKAVILGDDGTAASVASDLMKASPETKPFLSAYLKEAAVEGKHRAALFAILHLPGLRPEVTAGVRRETEISQIDNLRANWWCSGGRPSDFWSNYQESADTPGGSAKDTSSHVAQFLNQEQRRQSEEERAKLRKLTTGPNYLTESVLRWATDSPGDKRLPEALHFAIRSTHLGCSDKRTKELSRQAFDLLHRRFPENPWTKQTPYYFGAR